MFAWGLVCISDSSKAFPFAFRSPMARPLVCTCALKRGPSSLPMSAFPVSSIWRQSGGLMEEAYLSQDTWCCFIVCSFAAWEQASEWQTRVCKPYTIISWLPIHIITSHFYEFSSVLIMGTQKPKQILLFFLLWSEAMASADSESPSCWAWLSSPCDDCYCCHSVLGGRGLCFGTLGVDGPLPSGEILIQGPSGIRLNGLNVSQTTCHSVWAWPVVYQQPGLNGKAPRRDKFLSDFSSSKLGVQSHLWLPLAKGIWKSKCETALLLG